jgi:phage tail-like protein
MAEAQVITPATAFRFEVNVEGLDVAAGFTKVGGLKEATDPIEYREGMDKTFMRKFAGLRKYEDITLTRGVGIRESFMNWRNAVIACSLGYKKGLTISVKNCDGSSVARTIKVRQAWPISLEIGDLDAGSSEVAIESVVLAHEGQVDVSIFQSGGGSNLATQLRGIVGT